MSKDNIRTTKEQKIGKYKLVFTSRQGWSGPVYYRYDLKKKNILGFYNSKLYTTTVKDTANCQIDFYKKGEIKYRTDKCKQTVEKLKFGQTKKKLIGDKQTIDISTVDFIEISNHPGQINTVETLRKRLTNEQAKIFINKWNNAKSNGHCKYIVLYWVDITFKNGAKRTFRINEKNIKEQNDVCFDLGDSNYITQLWALTE